MICDAAKRKLAEIKQKEKDKEEYYECIEYDICPYCGGKIDTKDWWVKGVLHSSPKCKKCKRDIPKEYVE